MNRILLGLSVLLMIELLIVGMLWLAKLLVEFRCGRQGHQEERREVVRGVSFEIVCTKCGKSLFAGPYDPDPDVF